jgi:hypothetical protein
VGGIWSVDERPGGDADFLALFFEEPEETESGRRCM